MLEPASLDRGLREKRPMLWINPRLAAADQPTPGRLTLDDVRAAEGRLLHFAPLLVRLFPELEASDGIIESELRAAARLGDALMGGASPSGAWFLKCDHALPVAGSIKARGGIYEVLVHAEHLARTSGLHADDADACCLLSPEIRALFAQHSVAVGSTGNLGISIGIMAAALGFKAVVYMSHDAKAWKKKILRSHGVEIIECDGDFGAAIAQGRRAAASDSRTYFVDDEDSEHLFLGYSVAALRLSRQLAAAGSTVDAAHPLFVYIPCGVGGAPGGITFGLKQLFGDAVHCFFAEPVGAPSMLIRLASEQDAVRSMRDVGMELDTQADGLAVATASELVASTVLNLVSGIFTVHDDDLFRGLFALHELAGIDAEPSAAAALGGPQRLLGCDAGRQYLRDHRLEARMADATHVIWTTGGRFVPGSEFAGFLDRGSALAATAGGVLATRECAA